VIRLRVARLKIRDLISGRHKIFSVYRIQTGPGVRPYTYPVAVTRTRIVLFAGDKATRH
jgi:hypothetical protein